MKALQSIETTILDTQDIFKQVLNQYLMYKDGVTRETYERTLRRFFLYQMTLPNTEITNTSIMSYRLRLESRGLKPNSINKALAVLRDFFKWCYEMEYLAFNPAKGMQNVKVPKAELKQARALTDDELKALFSSTTKDTRRDFARRIMLLLTFNLGLRSFEVAKLKWCDIDLTKGTITILGKGKKTRVLGLHDDLMNELKEYIGYFDNLTLDDYIYQPYKNKLIDKPVSSQHINKMLKDAASKANLDMENVSSHAGRVTAINILLDQGISLRDTANFAGHSNISTTQRYDRKSEERTKQLAEIIKIK